jgi:cellulose synthase/poly-beta-1,6-N-acetylglucosamine synthase-like glycosyltransferase
MIEVDTHPVQTEDTSVLTSCVIICAYTEERWDLLCKAIESVVGQHQQPDRLVICIDHNERLFERASARWNGSNEAGFPVHVLANAFDGRLGSARNTGVGVSQEEIIAFLDDDAAAHPDWLKKIVGDFENDVVAVGGAPHPRFETSRPSWFPLEFDWVFGCTYKGLPTRILPVKHLIGASMAARRDGLVAIGGFHSDNHDDMDMCHRLSHQFPTSRILFDPDATVSHYVPASRVTWAYFWRRCYSVNKGKVLAFHNMGGAANLSAERSFVLKSLRTGARTALRDLLKGRTNELRRLIVSVCGIGLAGLGHIAGRLATPSGV